MTTGRGSTDPGTTPGTFAGVAGDSWPGRYDVERIKREHPLLEVVTAHDVRLRRIGAAIWRGRCPLLGHDDRTPSFTVYEREGRFKCFGGSCGAHGDVIDFVRLVRGLPDFAAACAYLGGLPAGDSHDPVAAGRDAVGRSHSPRRWDALTVPEQEVMNAAHDHYRRRLQRTPAVLAYLRQRGIADRTLARCGVGFAPGDTLAAALPTGQRELAGDLRLLYRAGGTWREALAGRIVVPELRDGNCLWCIGRALPGALAVGPQGGKYRALPGERPILGYAYAAGRPESVLCEGVLDWLTAVGWGLPAWSPCGTQLPPARLGFLAATRTVFGVFDADAAGRAAAARFAAILGQRFRPVALPEGCDLNDLARQPGGRERFLRLLDAARQVREW